MGYELARRRSLIATQTDETDAAYLVEQRVSNAYALAEHAYYRATRLNVIVTELSRDNPNLEMTGRRMEAACEMGSVELLHRYITRR